MTMIDIKENIIYQDQYLIAINKPSGVLSQSDKNNEFSLKESIEGLLKHEVFILNRIDRPVSGIIIYAKSKKSAAKLTPAIKKAEKKYIAIVEDSPPKDKDKLVDIIIKKGNKSIMTEDEIKGQTALLEYNLIGNGINYYYIDISLITGRFHQIRAQLSNIGCKIMGDVKYGARRGLKDRSIGLHAYKVSFHHPFTNKEISLNAKFPESPIWNDVNSKMNVEK
ncbi:MAG: RluA family pseudouridine synthase [Saprospiraceae bacterium]